MNYLNIYDALIERAKNRENNSISIKKQKVWNDITNIVKLRNENKTYRYIAKIYNVSHPTIMRIFKYYESRK